MEYEKWTNEILNSLEGMQKAEPSPYLYAKIQTRLKSTMEEKIPVRWAFLSMASLGLLLVINILFVKPAIKNTETDESNEIIYEQQLMNSDQLY